MPSAADYKAEGNKAFGAKKMVKAAKCYSSALELEKDDQARAALFSNRSAAYLSLQQLDKALLDANSAVRCRPDWGKAYARVAECYARQQDFFRAEIACKATFSSSLRLYGSELKLAVSGLIDKSAVEHAEDDAAKARYQASLDTTVKTHQKARDLHPAPDKDTFKAVDNADDSWQGRLGGLINRGFKPDERGALPLTLMALNCCQKGLATLDASLISRNPNGQIYGRFQSTAIQEFCECILLDEHAFFFQGGNNAFPITKKFSEVFPFELNSSNCMKYYRPAPMPAVDIIADLDKRRATEGDRFIRLATTNLIRGHILMAFISISNGDQAGAVTSCKLSLALLEAGAAKWADRDYSEKGTSFKPTFVRLVKSYLLKNLLRVHRDAQLPSAKRSVSLDDIEKLANEILDENPPAEWPPFDESHERVAYCLMPQWEAFSCLAYVHIAKARRVFTPSLDKVVFFDLDEAKKAAFEYSRTTAAMPDDWHDKANLMWYGIEAELRAGGRTVQEILDLVNAAFRVEEGLTPIWGPPPSPFDARDFVLIKVKELKELKKKQAATPDFALTATIKAVPYVSATGKPPGWNAREALTREEWAELPGKVMLVDAYK
ncbi:hypothetical protein JCM6882_001111 [Rhodosporidiobolus microsporus]